MDGKKEFACNCLDRINNWINNCDTKASIILAFVGVIFTMLLTSESIMEKLCAIILSVRNNTEWTFAQINISHSVIMILFILMAYYLSHATYCLIKSLTANIDIKNILKDDETIEKNSNLFFVTIASKKYEAYREAIDSNDDIILNDIYSQIYITAHICTVKFSNYNKAITKLKMGLAGLLLFIILLLVIY